ncbi:hypothetical protein [Roseibium aggregatum]|uniref:Uncharacterized protein n=1 Tax=Roseibium aggregatum TaxID=187304 RepID=A0A939J3C7_9HYPH|nr:hypothetical protein [Roseibium aggregatum]MBN9670452.1 hypothetical protein [Roseibium aggregatum]
MADKTDCLELGIAQAQAAAAQRRLSEKDGLKEQHRFVRHEMTERVLFLLAILLLLVTAILTTVDIAFGLLGLAVVAVFAMKIWRTAAVREKRLQDLRRMAEQKQTTKNATEIKDA